MSDFQVREGFNKNWTYCYSDGHVQISVHLEVSSNLITCETKLAYQNFLSLFFFWKNRTKKINFENCFLVFTLSTTFSEKTQIGKTVFINTDRKDSFYNLISFDFL